MLPGALPELRGSSVEYPGDVDDWIFVPSASMVGRAIKIEVISDSGDMYSGAAKHIMYCST